MKVPFYSSLTAKLFGLMALVVAMTVAGNSWQNSVFFQKYLHDNIKDNMISQAQGAANAVNAIIHNLVSQITVAMHYMQNVRAQELRDHSRNFLGSNREYLAFAIYTGKSLSDARSSSFVFTSNLEDTRFENENPQIIENLIRANTSKWLAEKTPAANGLVIKNLAPELKLPVLMIGIPFQMKTIGQTRWAVLLCWQNQIGEAIGYKKSAAGNTSASMQKYLVDNDGVIFNSTNNKDMISKTSLAKLTLTRDALKAQNKEGFRGYRDHRGTEWLGGYSRLPEFELTVLVQRDAKILHQAIEHSVRRTALWGSLFILIAIMVSFLVSSGITKNLRAVTALTLRVAAGDFSAKLRTNGRDEVGILSLAINHMSTQIQQLMQSQVEKARFEKELETARMVQSTFFPPQQISSGDLTIAGHYQPASECGGDWWGHFTRDDNIHYLFIADAMGHGVPAALVTAMAYSSCMMISDLLQNRDLHTDSPAKILSSFNRILFDAVKGKISMTFFAAVIDLKTGEMRYANAGHNFPVLMPMDANDERAGKKTKNRNNNGEHALISLTLKGEPLGIVRDAVFTEKSLSLRAGDKLFMFTDGLIECTSPAGKMWGRKTLLKELVSTPNNNAAQLKDEILRKAFGFFANNPIKDDVTVVTAEINKNWNTANNNPNIPEIELGETA